MDVVVFLAAFAILTLASGLLSLLFLKPVSLKKEDQATTDTDLAYSAIMPRFVQVGLGCLLLACAYRFEPAFSVPMILLILGLLIAINYA